ncbi:MAG: hypothetical protein V4627_13495 [Pseudomonadota bacterium]
MRRPVIPSLRAGGTGRTALSLAVTALTASLACAQDIPAATVPGPAIELKRAQTEPLTFTLPDVDPRQVPAPQRLDPRTSLPVPDRWRLVEQLGIHDRRWDPYNQNTLKGDRPFEPFRAWGPDWFLNLGVVSDTLVEARNLPTPVGAQSSQRPQSNDVFGQGRQTALAQTVIVSASVVKGNTTFKPPDYEFKFTGAFNASNTRLEEVRGLSVDPRIGTVRNNRFFAVQEAFADVHLRNVSDHYDFDALRVGIQPFTADFRGFLFNDQALGVRLLGNRYNNRVQYNLAWLRRIEKDTNSGLNDVSKGLRDDDTFITTVYHQDWPVPGHTTQFTLAHNRNREGGEPDFYDRNGFQVRPAVIGDVRGHNYDVTYLGANGDGHFGRWNLTTSFYAALGTTSYDPIAQQPQRVEAAFAAAELSRDFDWLRLRATCVLATGDKDPFDGRSTGFDAIIENPQIAGADTSYWIRQAIPLVGGGGVALSGRNGVLPSLRSGKDQGQSNFVNPGLQLLGVGADLDLTPQLRLVVNLSRIAFADTAVLQVLRNQGPVDRHLGTDLSVALQYRPFSTQNVVLNASLATLQPGPGYKQLFDSRERPYSALVNLLLTF